MVASKKADPKRRKKAARKPRRKSRRLFPAGARGDMDQLSDLDQRIHLAVRMRVLEGLNFGDIAKRLGTSEDKLQEWRLTKTWEIAYAAVVAAYEGDIRESALATYAEIMRESESEGMRMRAADSILDRTTGSVSQRFEGSVNVAHTLIVEQFGEDDHGGGNRNGHGGS